MNFDFGLHVHLYAHKFQQKSLYACVQAVLYCPAKADRGLSFATVYKFIYLTKCVGQSQRKCTVHYYGWCVIVLMKNVLSAIMGKENTDSKCLNWSIFICICTYRYRWCLNQKLVYINGQGFPEVDHLSLKLMRVDRTIWLTEHNNCT